MATSGPAIDGVVIALDAGAAAAGAGATGAGATGAGAAGGGAAVTGGGGAAVTGGGGGTGVICAQAAERSPSCHTAATTQASIILAQTLLFSFIGWSPDIAGGTHLPRHSCPNCTWAKFIAPTRNKKSMRFGARKISEVIASAQQFARKFSNFAVLRSGGTPAAAARRDRERADSPEPARSPVAAAQLPSRD
ncbi:MAG TPA: hypothetical protein VME41_02825 [Stellaceae bacterium]|nr:hypothetical protein [Stellaceae bacterium]